MKNYLKNTWFTLLELMIVTTIVGLISMATYIPYAHHQKKVLLKQASREITQSLSEARNLAINWADSWSWNLNIGLYFSADAKELNYYASTWSLDIASVASLDIYKTKPLPLWIQVDSIAGMASTEYLFAFDSITGSGSIEPIISDNEIEIQISYKWSTSPVLNKNILYYRQSYISDY